MRGDPWCGRPSTKNGGQRGKKWCQIIDEYHPIVCQLTQLPECNHHITLLTECHQDREHCKNSIAQCHHPPLTKHEWMMKTTKATLNVKTTKNDSENNAYEHKCKQLTSPLSWLRNVGIRKASKREPGPGTKGKHENEDNRAVPIIASPLECESDIDAVPNSHEERWEVPQ